MPSIAAIAAAASLVAGCSHTVLRPGFYRNNGDPTVYRLQPNGTYCLVPSMQMLNEYGGLPVVHSLDSSVSAFASGYAAADPIACGWPDGIYRKASSVRSVAGYFYRNVNDPTVYMLQLNLTYCTVMSMRMLNAFGGPSIVRALTSPVPAFTAGYRQAYPLACGWPHAARQAGTMFRISGDSICALRATGHVRGVIPVDASTDLSLHKHFTGACTHG